MALSITQQLTDLIRTRKHHLIVFRAYPLTSSAREKSDAIGASLALARFLRTQNVRADIASHDFRAPEALQFLDGIDAILPALPPVQKCVITIDLTEQGFGSVHYDIQNEVLSLFVTPKKGGIDPTSITAKTTPYSYDCIWVLNTQEWSGLGDLYLKNTDLFHHVPTVVLDYAASNEHFGNINVIDITAASTSEVVYRLAKDVSEKDIDATMATQLLTGIIARTKSFKTTTMNPRTLALASQLMENGANRDSIVDHLYRQRKLSTLKLWGTVLTRITQDTRHNLAIASLPADAFLQAGADESELPEIIDEIISNAPEAAIAVLLYESPQTKKIQGLLYTEKPIDARALVQPFTPEGTRTLATFTVEAPTLVDAQRIVVEQVIVSLSQYKISL